MDFLTDTEIMSRIQFAITISFHYLFPPLTIGLGFLLVAMEWKWLRTGDPVWERTARFWTSMFAINFALGVATGIVMEFEFGTNWSEYSRFVGDVFGSMLAAEGLWAFFLESGFLAVLVFGWDKVSRRFHFFATLMVCLGSTFSSIWIVMANSWMQTPTGFAVEPMIRDGVPWIIDGQPVNRAVLTDFFAAILNPSSINRITHVWVGAATMGSFFVLSISAYWILRGRHLAVATRSFGLALILAAIGTVGAMLTGDANARMVAVHQPVKLAAMEGVYDTTDRVAPLTIIGMPDDAESKMDWEIGVPGALTALVYRRLHDEQGHPLSIPGLDLVPEDDRPMTMVVYACFHIMVGCGTFLVGVVGLGIYHWLRGTLWNTKWLLLMFIVGVAPAAIANQTGWFTAETGRQPWVVHPASPRVDPDKGAMSPLWLVNTTMPESEQVRLWTPGDPVDDLEGWHYPYGKKVVTDPKGGHRVLEANVEPGDDVTISYDGTKSMRTSDGFSKALRSGAVLWACVMFLLIYFMLSILWIVVLNHKIHKGPDHYTPSGGEGGLIAAMRRALGEITSMTGLRGGSSR